ncbi:MAG: malate dehydrogenase [Gammaproteobacteria bacterium WSBS_2016_MAG_OTU1]
MNKPYIKVAISGAAGQIGYSLLFRIASGQLFGPNCPPVHLSLLEAPAALPALDGVEMELADCAFSHVHSISKNSNSEAAFGDADVIFLVGAKPRGPGMERKDLLAANAEIFSVQGKAINAAAGKGVNILVVGNPANTNCLIAQQNAPDIRPEAFSAMTRLDHNRSLAQLAQKTGTHTTDIKKVIIWGNHSATQYPDIHHATIGGKAATDLVDDKWYKEEMIPAIQQRGATVIKARGASSAASAASAALDHVHDWAAGNEDYLSMGVVSKGEYGIEAGIVYSYPMQCTGAGEASVITDLACNEFSMQKMKESEAELRIERDAIRHLLP